MRTWIGIACVMTLASAAFAQSATTHTWTGVLPPGSQVEIRNVNGNIRIEPSGTEEIRIEATVRGTRPDPSSVFMDVAVHEGGVVACTIYLGLSVPSRCLPDRGISVTLYRSDIQVNYVAHVPANVVLKATTVNGGIELNARENRAALTTVNGRIVAASDAALNATVVNGSIIVALGRADWSGKRELRTVNGSIDVELPPAANLHVRATTVHGTIETDFPLPVERRIVGVTLDGTIGEGGRDLELSTVNGSIHVRRAPESTESPAQNEA